MSLWLQNLTVFATVLACVGFVSRQAYLSLSGRKSRLGQCCSNGCSSKQPDQTGTNQEKPQRIIFMPSEMLTRRRK